MVVGGVLVPGDMDEAPDPVQQQVSTPGGVGSMEGHWARGAHVAHKEDDGGAHNVAVGDILPEVGGGGDELEDTGHAEGMLQEEGDDTHAEGNVDALVDQWVRASAAAVGCCAWAGEHYRFYSD